MTSIPNTPAEGEGQRPVRYRLYPIEHYEAKQEARFWKKVDKTGACWLWTGSTSTNGYGTLTITEYNPESRLKDDAVHREIRAHRYSWELSNGPIAEGMEIDHICHDKLCVRPLHLRLTTRKQNNENRRGANSNSTSGVRGVFWNKARNRWRATVGHNGKSYHCGYFVNLEDAEAAVIAKRRELHTHNTWDRMPKKYR